MKRMKGLGGITIQYLIFHIYLPYIISKVENVILLDNLYN